MDIVKNENKKAPDNCNRHALTITAINVPFSYASSGPSQNGHVKRDGWEADFSKDSGAKIVTAAIKFDLSNAQAAQKMIATQRSLADELVAMGVPTLDITVVFRHPLHQKAFERFVSKHSIATVQSYLIRYVDKQGKRVTINGAPLDGQLVPVDPLNFALSDLNERAPGKVKGWVQLQATVTPEILASISSDAHVYLVDVSGSVIRESIKSEGDNSDYSFEIVTPQLFWQLEDIHEATQETVE